MSRVVRALIERKLLRVEPSPIDQRVQILSLTPAGRAAYERALPHMRARREHLIGALESEERAHLFSLLARIEQASEAYEAQI